MDLLKTMLANRATAPKVSDPTPRKETRGKKPSKTDRAKEHRPGSKSMRQFIIDEKPTKAVVKDHFAALIEDECASSSDEE
jgi:hypothetical protein